MHSPSPAPLASHPAWSPLAPSPSLDGSPHPAPSRGGRDGTSSSPRNASSGRNDGWRPIPRRGVPQHAGRRIQRLRVLAAPSSLPSSRVQGFGGRGYCGSDTLRFIYQTCLFPVRFLETLPASSDGHCDSSQGVSLGDGPSSLDDARARVMASFEALAVRG